MLACVSGLWVVIHSDVSRGPLAGKAVGLAGLSRALKWQLSATPPVAAGPFPCQA